MTHNPDRYTVLGNGETVHGHHYRNTPHGPQLVEAHHIGTIIDADTEDEFLVELPPDMGHMQHIAGAEGFVEPGDVLAGDHGLMWAKGELIGERFIRGVTKHTGYRVYRRIPVPRQGSCDGSGWKRVAAGEVVPHATPAPAPKAPGPVAMPADHSARKELPLVTGVLHYFPDALLAVAACSKAGNDQHNPGKPLHWDRSKSGDELDALGRHLLAAGTRDSDRIRHSAKVAWRALANLQKEIEQEGVL